ncbi:hypothetical protein ACLBWT_18695 [Paenibacillus sp. D51F]
MKRLKTCFSKYLGNEKGVMDLIVLLIILPIFLCITLSLVAYFSFMMRQAKIDDVKDRALQMVQTQGYFTSEIEEDLKDKLATLGYPEVTKNGITYPSFTGSTRTKVFRDDPDPTVKLVIQYPATELNRIFILLGGGMSSEDPGYFRLEGYGRSEKYN